MHDHAHAEQHATVTTTRNTTREIPATEEVLGGGVIQIGIGPSGERLGSFISFRWFVRQISS